ncbi:MAG: AIR synthase [Anaerolineaceae bacterium]|nr:AIR synthase [Anaerolineaceae bacterium]
MAFLPLGKLPPDLLENIIKKAPLFDSKVILGPGTGLDCAVIDNGDHYLVYKSDPITFTADNIGWYSVQINLNDLVTTGAKPKWMLSTLLLPEKKTTAGMVEKISQQLFEAAAFYKISLIGGHTEITHHLDRPLLISTLIGEVSKDNLITPKGAQTGDRILLTKGIPIEATAILAADFETRLSAVLSPSQIESAKQYLFNPGISVYKEARLAVEIGGVNAMHDPTEGGLAAALWELAIASDKQLLINPDNIHMPTLSATICRFFDLNPLFTIASGALLMAVSPNQSQKIIQACLENQIDCFEIGEVGTNGAEVLRTNIIPFQQFERPMRDDLGKVYEKRSNLKEE